MASTTHSAPTELTGLPLIGAQLSSAGGWSQILARAQAAEAEVVQVFSSNPRIWPTSPPEATALADFGASLREHHLPLFIHAIYLINPASPDEGLRTRSAEALRHALVTGALAGAAGVVTHLGSHRGEGFDVAAPWVADTLRKARAEAEADLGPSGAARMPPLLLETAAGAGATVGAILEELVTLLELLALAAPADSRPWAGVCLDTAHMFAAGYALHEAEGLAALVAEMEQKNLLRRLGLIHLNDSASLYASRRDRHANPGDGEFGYAGVARLVTHPAFAHIPFVLEVPGTQGHGPGLLEITLVKRMRQGAPDPRHRPDAVGRGPVGPE